MLLQGEGDAGEKVCDTTRQLVLASGQTRTVFSLFLLNIQAVRAGKDTKA